MTTSITTARQRKLASLHDALEEYRALVILSGQYNAAVKRERELALAALNTLTRHELDAHGSVRFLRLEARRVLTSIRAIVFMGVVMSARPACAQRPSPDSLPSGRPVTVRTVSGDDQVLRVLLYDVGGFRTEQVRQVIRDQPSWESFWSHARVSSARRVPPSVDFGRDMVIAAADSQSLAGPAIAILGAVERADSLYVLVRSGIGILPGCRDNAYEHPMAMALLPKTNDTVVFVEMKRNERCGYRPPS